MDEEACLGDPAKLAAARRARVAYGALLEAEAKREDAESIAILREKRRLVQRCLSRLYFLGRVRCSVTLSGILVPINGKGPLRGGANS